MSTLEGQLAKSYDLGSVILVVGGVPLGGHGADGGVVVEPNADLFEMAVGATGLTTFSKLNDDVLMATITVKDTSLAYATLAGFMKIQQLTPLLIAPLAFLLVDPGNGDTVNSAFCVFMRLPTVSKLRVASEREFLVALPGAAASAVFGVANVI